MVKLMLKLHKDLPNAKTPHEAEALQRQMAATDRQIDTWVYELYGLTEEEIRIVKARHDWLSEDSRSCTGRMGTEGG